MRYWLKKGKRITKKQIRYDCRQNLAKQRFRFQGRFITKAEMEQLDRDQIYDPSLKEQLPRPKRIFRVDKEHHQLCRCKDRVGYKAASDAETTKRGSLGEFDKSKAVFSEEHQEQNESTHSSQEIRIPELTRLCNT